ncbi:MAG TPA: hypothetical protein DCZ01_03300, partial [Elusimicrobia bacterium]|nr:hypothetical protein [Elusimicrobiota bacterium]
MTGGVKESNQRHVVANAWGYWIFFANGSQTPSWTYSATGDPNDWRAGPSPNASVRDIFEGTGYTGMNAKPSVWYVKATSDVYVAVGDDGTVSNGNRLIHMRKGQLQSNGDIAWAHSGEVNLTAPCLAAQGNMVSNAPVSIAVDTAGFVWINHMTADNGNVGTTDNLVAYSQSNTAYSVGSSSWPAVPATGRHLDGINNCSGNSDGDDNEAAYINLVVPKMPKTSPVNMVWQVGLNASEGIANLYSEDDNTASTAELGSPGSPLTIDWYPGNTNAGLEENSNASAVVDSTGNLHIAWIDVNRDVRYARFSSTDGLTNVHIASNSAVNFTSVSIGLASSTLLGISTDTIYIAMVDANGDLFAYSAATSALAAADWSFIYENLSGAADKVSLAYSVTKPAPLPLVYGNSGSVYFDWLITSTVAAPSLFGIAIASSPNTAPYTTGTYDLQITGGSGFLDLTPFNLGKTRAKILLNGADQTNISVTGTTLLTPTSLNISVKINPPIPNSGGPFDIQVINPDGQSYTLSKAFGISAPSVTVISDPDPSDGKTSGAGFQDNTGASQFYRTLTIYGSQFMDWGSTNTTTLQFLNGGVPLNTVTVATVTAFTPGSAAGTLKASLKISTAAVPGGPFEISLKNPTGQTASLLSEPNTFYITIATASILYPVLGNGLAAQAYDPLRPMTTGFSIIQGGMYFGPKNDQAFSDGQASTSTQIKIKRADGAIWNGDPTIKAFQTSSFFNDEEAYFSATNSSDPWSYAWTPDDGEYDLSARARTSDQPKKSDGSYTGAGGPETGSSAATPLKILVDHKAPIVGIIKPTRGTGASSANAFPLQFTINDALGYGSGGANTSGSGVQKAYVLIMSSNPTSSTQNTYLNGTDTATWVSWDCTDTSCSWDSVPSGLKWISTGTAGSPALQWGTKVLFRSISISSNSNPGNVWIPDWKDGKEYYIAVVSTDAMPNIGTSETIQSTGAWSDVFPSSSPGGYRFIYDVTVPTVAANAGIVILSTDAASYGWVTAVVASGTVSDNVASNTDPRQVFLRILDVDAGKYLNPNTLIKFDVTDGNAAWSEISDKVDTWAFGVALAQFVNGNRYKLELYGQDGAGNFQDTACPMISTYVVASPGCQTGSSANPKYKRYFRFAKVAPTVSVVT